MEPQRLLAEAWGRGAGKEKGRGQAVQVQSVRKTSGGREGGSYLPHCEDFLNSLSTTALYLLLLCHCDRNTSQKPLKAENSYLSPGFRGFQSFLVWKAGVSIVAETVHITADQELGSKTGRSQE